MSKFIAASRQATRMDQERIRLETRIREVQADNRDRAEVAAKAMDEVKELKKKTLSKSLRLMPSRKILVLTIFKS